jgi:hypothetical protein
MCEANGRWRLLARNTLYLGTITSNIRNLHNILRAYWRLYHESFRVTPRKNRCSSIALIAFARESAASGALAQIARCDYCEVKSGRRASEISHSSNRIHDFIFPAVQCRTCPEQEVETNCDMLVAYSTSQWISWDSMLSDPSCIAWEAITSPWRIQLYAPGLSKSYIEERMSIVELIRCLYVARNSQAHLNDIPRWDSFWEIEERCFPADVAVLNCVLIYARLNVRIPSNEYLQEVRLPYVFIHVLSRGKLGMSTPRPFIHDWTGNGLHAIVSMQLSPCNCLHAIVSMQLSPCNCLRANWICSHTPNSNSTRLEASWGSENIALGMKAL